MVLVDIQWEQYLLPGFCFFFTTLMTTDISCFLNDKNSKIVHQHYFVLFKNTRASVDCAEFKCEMPRNYSQQGNYFSSYKSNCTIKCLITVNRNRAACFISDLYEGSITGVDIFDQCEILQQINLSDASLVDKGLTIQHLLLKKQATIFIPPFLGERDTFTNEEVMLIKRIAKARIHVERFNERLNKI